MNHILVLDIETTGLNQYKCAMVQLAALIVDEKYEVVDELKTYVKPFDGAVIEEEALKINGITEKDWINAPTEIEAIEKLNKLLITYGKPPIYGFNVNFDLAFLSSICFRNRIYLEECGLHMDVKAMVRDISGSYKYSLKSMCAEFGVTNVKAHDGLSDCKATLELLKAVELKHTTRV